MKRLELSNISYAHDKLFFEKYKGELMPCKDREIDIMYFLQKRTSIGNTISISLSHFDEPLLEFLLKNKSACISVDMEGKILEEANFIEVFQYRYANALSHFADTIYKIEQEMQLFKRVKAKYKVVVIYIGASDYAFVDKLRTCIDIFANMGFLINIMLIPKQLSKNEFLDNEALLEVCDVVSRCVEAYGDRVYGDFPAISVQNKYNNLKGRCPASLFSLNVNGDGIITPCKFSNIQLGNIDDDIVDVWEKWNNILIREDLCLRCEENTVCGRGCIANWEDDYYDILCRKRG